MKVLKKGNENPKLKTMEVTCSGKGFSNQKPCGSLLEITGLDVRTVIHHDYGGGADRYFYIICSECGAKTEISAKDLPYEMIQLSMKED